MEDSKFMSAERKELVLKQWETFLKHGMKRQNFLGSLYHHLTQHCSFIAHYDRHGFYSTYFTTGEMRAHFLSQFDIRKAGPNGIPPSIEYGMTYWAEGEYADINMAMVRVASPLIPMLVLEAEASQRDADVAEARRLMAKHGMTLEERR